VIVWLSFAGGAAALLLWSLIQGDNFRRDAKERFAAGRKLPWFMLGGSLAATMLSADTPLLVSGAFYKNGLAGNWFWLAGIPGTLATLFFFARNWRRSGVLTEVEILSLRHGDTKISRGFKAIVAIFDAGGENVLVLASVTYAAKLFVEHLLGPSNQIIFDYAGWKLSEASFVTFLLMTCTALYALTSGFRFVVKVNVLHLLLFLLITVLVASLSLNSGIREAGGFSKLLERLPRNEALFNLFQFDDVTVILLLLFGWWQKAPGTGMFVQRLISAKSEHDAILSALFYTLIHYVARAWPWYAVGALALIYFPNLEKGEQAFPVIVQHFLPDGLQHLVALAFCLAFTSAVDSRLNWGASYFVNDVYTAFSDHRDSRVARKVDCIFILVIAFLAVAIALSGVFSSIAGIYKYILVVQSGRAVVAIARWYWWRVTIWSEISAMMSSLVVGNACALIFDLGSNQGLAAAVTLNTALSGIITVAVSYWTSRMGPSDSARAFNSLVQVKGPGWRPLNPERDRVGEGDSLLVLAKYWLYSVVLTYGLIALISGLIVSNRTMITTAAAVDLLTLSLLLRDWRQLISSLDLHWSD
jgi:SSS family solute:Na+ symporter